MEEGAIIDSENFKGMNGEFGFKEIVLRQLQKVVTNMSQEMRAGFWIYSQSSPAENSQKVRYIGDSRKELKQSIDTLHDLLLPKFDNEMKKESDSIYKQIEEWDIECSKKEKAIEGWNKKLKLYRTLFQQLCFFLERLGWLENTGIEE